MTKLCFLNACDAKYSCFIVPYIYFSSIYNKDAAYEFLLTCQIDESMKKNIENLSKIINRNIVLREFKGNIKPDRLRWLQVPSIDFEFAYIGDIDIMILEDVIPFHLKKMEQNLMPYDNVSRPTNHDLTSGLQFCSKEYFNLIADAKKNIKDFNERNERMLNRILRESKLKIIDSKNGLDFIEKRPIHGIHISLNREPFKSGTMKFACDKIFANRFLDIIESDEFKNQIKPLFSLEFNKLYDKILPYIEKFK